MTSIRIHLPCPSLPLWLLHSKLHSQITTLSVTPNISLLRYAAREMYLPTSLPFSRCYWLIRQRCLPKAVGPGVTEPSLVLAKKHENRSTPRAADAMASRLVRAATSSACRTDEFVGRSYIICAEKYLDLPSSKQVVLPIVAVNGVVFAAWTIAGIRRGSGGALWRFMTRESSFIDRAVA